MSPIKNSLGSVVVIAPMAQTTATTKQVALPTKKKTETIR